MERVAMARAHESHDLLGVRLGQVVPRSVRNALGLREGDHVVFGVDGRRATLSNTPDLIDLAGSVPVPAELRARPWSEIIEMARAERTRRIVEGPGDGDDIP